MFRPRFYAWPYIFFTCWVEKLYFPIRSVQPSFYSVRSLYVPTRSYYVPITFLYAPPAFWNKNAIKLYVPKRSVQPSRYSVRSVYVPTSSYWVPIHSACFFKGDAIKWYVPVHSVQPFRWKAKMLYLPVRSYYVPPIFRKIWLRCSLPTSITRSFRHRATCPQKTLATAFWYVPTRSKRPFRFGICWLPHTHAYWEQVGH